MATQVVKILGGDVSSPRWRSD